MPSRMAIEESQDVVPLVRDRETYRYLDLSYIHGYIDGTTESFPPARPSRDSALTAFTQLAVHRLGAHRAFVSLLDRRLQYVVAETTASAGLRRSAHAATEEGLILCGLAFPYAQGLSSHVLQAVSDSLTVVTPGSELPWRPPVVVVPDVQADSRFAASRILHTFPDVRFYAAVPIRSPAGPFVGVLSISDNKPRPELSAIETEFLRDMSLTVMDHLTMIHHRQEEARGKRMMRGLGSFVEGSSTMSSLASNQWHGHPSRDFGQEGMLNVAQQAKMLRQESLLGQAEAGAEAASSNADLISICPEPQDAETPASFQLNSERDSTSSLHSISAESLMDLEPVDALDSPSSSVEVDSHGSLKQQAESIFSRAANVIRESIEVEGVLFFDASIATAGSSTESGNSENMGAGHTQSSNSVSSGEESVRSISSESDAATGNLRMCDILGFSTTETASIDGHRPDAMHLKVPERFLRLLLRRYSKGKIFNFDENGLPLSDSESDGSDHDPSTIGDLGKSNTSSVQRLHRRQRSFTRAKEPSFIIKIFPGARSVIAFPLWDSHRSRWYAGGVAWTRTPTRVFGVKSELSYLRAFGATIMAEIAKLDAQQANQAKSDVLGSISHELRSPLHGILGSVELFQETNLDVFQNSTIHVIERCGMTLLDTIDHLLDYAKVNNHLRAAKASGKKLNLQHGLRPPKEGEHSPSSTFSEVNVDAVVEEVIEGMFAGHEFQKSSHNQYASSADYGSVDPETRTEGVGKVHKDFTATLDELARSEDKIILDIRPASSWRFSTQIGALRRIIMNIFGNALKYTTTGQIRITLYQEERLIRNKRSTDVKFVVEDTGRGISKEFLAHHLFTPFVQEDSMTPGTGLGLSITQKIVKSLGGSIHAQSKPGRGTIMSVSLPLSRCAETPISNEQDAFAVAIGRLRSLRVGLRGFDDLAMTTTSDNSKLTDDWQLPRTTIAQQCQDWLGMKVVSSTEAAVNPDIYLATLAGAEDLAELNEAGDVFQPVVVICPNAWVARNLSTTSRTLDRNGVFEYIAQPCGPRKLAKTFTLALDRWANVQIQQASEALGQSSQPPLTSSSVEGSEHNLTPGGTTLSGRSSASPPIISSLSSKSTATTVRSSPEELEVAHAVSSESGFISQRTVVFPRVSPTLSPAPLPEPQACMPYLVVDDSAINVKILTTFLRRKRLPVASASDGALGVAAFKAARGAFSCVFMDVQMPHLDGISATRAIREYERRERLRPVYIVMLTGLAMLDILQEAEACGANDFFPKPVRLKELNPIIAKARRNLVG